MNDLIGILIPLLMSGADMQTIFRHLSGANGAASYDGLRDMMSRRNASFAMRNPLGPTREMVGRNASAFVDTIGVNPYTGFGQGLTDLIGSMYNVAPDIVGGFIGLPNPGSFYQQIANGASGISVASGRGLPQIFNPYSARDSYNNAVDLARQVHGFATTEGHGFNVDFTHGLNMSEVGTVAQRLLSSNIPYTGRDGRRLDLSKDEKGDYISQNDADEFSDNLKKLGGKFNETVSMLAKITGSVKDAIDLMDSLGGGNFLGGTADDALAVARKARNMAANIRITSAMAGMDPREAYSNMSALQQGLVSKYGVNPMLAAASGFDSMMMSSAYKGTMAYQMWAAQNPNATEREKTMVMAGAQARVMQYAGTNGEALAAMVSANKDRFSEDDLKAIEAAYRMGRPNDIRNMVRDRMGAQAYEDYMNDPAAIMGFRLSGDKELQGRFESAALEGNLRLAEVEGGRRMLRNDLAGTDRELDNVSGDRRNRGKERREASAEALRELAVKNGMSKEFAATRDIKQLRAYLMDNGVDMRVVERTENTAAIDRQMEEIDSLKMTDEEEKSAKTRLKKVISDSNAYSDDKKKEILASIDKDGADLNAIYDQHRKYTGEKADRSVLDGKMSAAHAENLKKRLEGHKAYWAVENTPEEMKRAVDALAGSISIKNSSGLLGMVASEEFLSDRNDLGTKEGRKAALDRMAPGALKDMFDALGADDSEAGDKFYEAAEKLAKSGALDLKAFEKIDKKTLGTKEGRKAALDSMAPGALKDMFDALGAEDSKAGDKFYEAAEKLAKSGTIDLKAFEKIGKTDRDALVEFDKKAVESERQGLSSLGEGGIEGVRKEAYESVVRDKLFSGGIGNLEETVRGKDGKLVRNKKYDEFVSNVAGRIQKEVEGGASIKEARQKVLGELVGEGKMEATKALVGDKGVAEIQRLANSDDEKSSFGRKEIASAEQSAISRNTAKSITNASKDMFDALGSDDSKAGDKFYEAAEKLAKAGALDLKAFEKIDKKTLGTKEGRKAALDGMAPDAYNKRLDAIRAAVGTGDAQTAMLANIATMAERKNLSLDVDTLKSMGLDMTDEQLGNFVSYLDKSSAKRSQNALANAINLGSGSFGREEIERSRKMIGDLRDAMKSVGIESDELDKYDKAGAEDKKKIRDEWAKKLGGATREVEVDEGGKKVKKTVKVFEDSEYASKLAASLVEKGKIGNVDAKKILSDSSVDLGKLDDKGLASVTKEAYQKDSVSYDILESVSKIADTVGKIMENPMKVFVTGYDNGAKNNMTEATRRGVDQGTFGQ